MSIIPWIALVMADDADCRARDANKRSQDAQRRAGGNQFVIVRLWDTKEVYDPHQSFWKMIWMAFTGSIPRKIADEPFTSATIRISDIENMRSGKDDFGTAYVCVQISQYANLYLNANHVRSFVVKGTLEEVTAQLQAVGG